MACGAFPTRRVPAELPAHKTLPSQGEITDAPQLFGRTQREPLGTPHSGSGALRAGTLNFKCLGVLVVFDSDELAQLSDAVEWQRLREQISRMTLCRNLHHLTSLHRSLLAAEDVSCARASPSQVPWSTTPWLQHASVTRVLFPSR